jgi:hypothetical protein
LAKGRIDLQALVLVLQYLLANLLRSGPDTRALRTLFEVTTSELEILAIKDSELPGSDKFVEALRLIEHLRAVFLAQENEPSDSA